MKRVLVIWPPKLEYVFSIQKHYTNFGETVAFLSTQPDLDVKAMDGSALIHFRWDFIEEYSTQYDYLVVYTDMHNSISAIDAMQQCKDISPNTVAISYGQGTPYAPEVFLEQGFDAAITDPMYQESILQYIRYRSGAISARDLRGMSYAEDGRVLIVHEKNPLDVSRVPFPALDQIPVQQYKRISGRDQLCFTVSRGCPYNCRFCRVPVDQGRSVSYKPVPELIDYVKSVKDDYASVKLIAATFTANRDWVMEFCKSVLSAGVQFNWIVTTRIELLDRQMLQTMAEAGCIAVAFGLETLYEDTQRRVDKHFPLGELTSKINLIHASGIIPKAFIMLGIPGQTTKEIQDTYAYLKTQKVEVRPKEYYPYEEMQNCADKLSLLRFFERDRVYKSRLEGVTAGQYVGWLLERTTVR